MSLQSLRNIQAKAETKMRSAALTAEEVESRAKDLFDKVEAAFMRHCQGGKAKIPLKKHPKAVIDRVVAVLKEKGVKAKYVYNGYDPYINRIDIDVTDLQFQF